MPDNATAPPAPPTPEHSVEYWSGAAGGARFHVEAKTPNGPITAETRKGKVRTWVTLDAAARWVRSLGVGGAHINLTHWQPGQRELSV